MINPTVGYDARLVAAAKARRPLQERGGRLRGSFELLSGCYPGFLFGLGVGDRLPVFHLHEETVASLEPRLQYLAENGYRTVTTNDIVRFVRHEAALPAKTVALTFDDAWVSLWTVAAPLLRRYGLTATAFAIPARIEDAAAVRPTIDDAGGQDVGGPPFVTWPELRALADSGVIDVQSHSHTHAVVCSERALLGFVTPDFRSRYPTELPLDSTGEAVTFVRPDDLGTPLFPTRSRLSDARRFFPDSAAVERCRRFVDEHGHEAFFARADWEEKLRAAHGAVDGRFETDAERTEAIREELVLSREVLEARLKTTVRSVALPWGVAGNETRRALRASGYDIAFAESLWRVRIVARGDDALGLMRLNGKFIPCLPGRRRRTFFSTA